MFPPPRSDDLFFTNFDSHQEDFVQQNLILGQASLEEISNLTNKKNNDCEKKISRKEIERQRRQHMSNLNASLRSLLPLESIKGKRSVNDQLHEAEKYITHLKKNIEELSVKRDKLKNLPDPEAPLDYGNTSSENCLTNCVSISPYCGGVEIVIGGGLRDESLLLSRVLEVVVEEGLDVVQSVSTQTDEGFFHTIRSQIAVKRLKTMSAKAEMEFAVEVEILGRVRHKNLLGLRGFYAGGDERLIVYDYMPNHSLITHLHGQLATDCLLDWRRRMSILIGSAEGLAYLHHEANPHIIHRDIKASNVLLDTEFQAKVADFGFAKLIPEGVTHLTTRVKGTLGYLAPEYAMWGKVSESCDVYSFGVLLLEIISAKKPLEKLPGGVKRDIVQWVTPYAQKGAFDHIADPRLKGKFNREQLKSTVVVALRCTDSTAENRPSMLEVVDWLKGGVGRRKKEISDMDPDMVDEEDEDTDTDFEGHRYKMEQSNVKRTRVGIKKVN
ncbi:hypothetical protein ACOSQ2_027581 [Xanthoceras sorbifolium]